MERYLMISVTDIFSVEHFEKCIEDFFGEFDYCSTLGLGDETEEDNNYAKLYYSLLLPQHQKTGTEISNDEKWNESKNRNNVQDILTLYKESLNNDQEEALVGLDDLADKVHHLAKSIPKLGAYVDVLWLSNGKIFYDIDKEMAWYGSLKCLVSWHQAQIFVMPTGATCHRLLQPWVDSLYARLEPSSDSNENHKPTCVWRGSISIASSQGVKPVRLAGYVLETFPMNHEPILKPSKKKYTKDQTRTPRKTKNKDMAMKAISRPYVHSAEMELIARLPSSEVPSYLISHKAFHLYVPSSSSCLVKCRKLLQNLYENEGLSYLVRIPYSTKWHDTRSDQTTADSESHILSTRRNDITNEKSLTDKGWQDLVAENIANITDFQISAELERLNYHHLLLQADHDMKNGNLDSPRLVAYLFHPLDKLNGSIVHDLTMMELSQPLLCEGWMEKGQNERKEKARVLLEKLPHFTAAEFVQLQDDIQSVQLIALEKWIEEKTDKGGSTVLDVSELSSLLYEARNQFVQHITSTSSIGQSQRELQSPNCIVLPRPEYLQDASTQLERLALSLKESQCSKFSKMKSSDSLGGLSPPQKGKVVTLSAVELLKFFKQDGTASKQNLKPVSQKSPSRQFSKYNSGEGKLGAEAAWPLCENSHFHDTYYNIGDDVEAKENYFNKLKARIQSSETASTCTVGQPQCRVTFTLNSPRSKMDSPRTKNVLKEEENSIEEDIHKIDQGGHTESSRGTKRKSGDTSDINKKVLVAHKKRQQDSQQKSFQSKSSTGDPRQKGSKARGTRKKSEQEAQLGDSNTNTSSENAAQQKESRSQRHKRKLEEVVKSALESKGVVKGDAIFKPCAVRLYNLVKCFVKDLKSSHNLRQEMGRLAQCHVDGVIQFEKTKT